MLNFLKRINGFSLPLIGGGLNWKDKTSEKETTKASFLFYGDHRTPEPIKLENIYRWYTFQHITQDVANKDNYRKNWLIFLVFDKDVNPRRLKTTFSSDQRPIIEVKDFSARSCIVFTDDEMPSGTLEIEVEQ